LAMPLQYPPKGRWRSLPFGTKCPSLAFALENQDIPHNYVQQSVIFTTKLDALTLQNYATSVSIQLCYLPCYSPQLNLIERFWKFIRNECLYSKYYANFAVLAVAISNCIATANTDKQKKFNSLFTLEFQIFQKVKVLAV
ncbi:MAG: transposase, partial [Richelia sp.]|nr:transposase [Richelia sp.]